MRVLSFNRPLVAILSLAFLALIYVFISLPQPQREFNPRGSLKCPKPPSPPPPNGFRRIPCVIDGHRRFSCLRDNDDVYFPFDKFIKKQFDATGKLVESAGNASGTRFEYYSSYSKVRLPEFSTYDPLGPFGHFASYNVENRDRVRCMKNGVPMSVQWRSTPYFYPIQIAQFALQHYSRNLTGDSKVVEEDIVSQWTSSSDDCTVVMESSSTELSCSLVDGTMSKSLKNVDPNLLVLVFRWLPLSDASFSVLVDHARLDKPLVLNYLPSDEEHCVVAEDETEFNYYLNLPKSDDEYTVIARDILVDVNKAMAILEKSKTDKNLLVVKTGDIRLVEVQFKGSSRLKGQLTLKSSAHEEMFITAADWFVDNQNERGGWAVPVQRSIADNRLILKAGWHSAMAQGHGLSVLTRAYAFTKEEKYIEAANRALQLFKTAASEGGILNRLFDHDWYEEYPTTPGTFVINGFMYSLLGLYDMSQLNAGDSKLADEFYKTGLRSLKTFLPLYDTGSGSLYDLRHLGIGSPPNLARWDYHAVHIYLLKWLYHIDGDEKLNAVADRWVNYAKGKKAKHN